MSCACAVARMARPSRVRLHEQQQAGHQQAGKYHDENLQIGDDGAGRFQSEPAAAAAGKLMYCLPQISIARFCSTMDMPMAVMSAASRGARRSGR